MTDIINKDFPVTITLPVLWGDQDMFGHVNNTRFMRWLESSRIAYFLECGIQVANTGVGPILASVTCNYRKQVKYPDSIIVGARVTQLGRTSITIEHSIWSQHQSALCAEGQSTVVVFDYQLQKAAPISDELRATIETLEGRTF